MKHKHDVFKQFNVCKNSSQLRGLNKILNLRIWREKNSSYRNPVSTKSIPKSRSYGKRKPVFSIKERIFKCIYLLL